MNPPCFPVFKPLSLEDRPVIEDILSRHPSPSCEMNFANLYIWRNSEHPRWTVLNGNLCILVEPDFEPPYVLPPAGEGDLEDTAARCLAVAPRLSRVPEETAARLSALFSVEPDPANFDYVYLAEDLGKLCGKAYDGKRNRIKKFEAENHHEYRPMAPGDRQDCRRLLEAWFEEKGDDGLYLKAEKEAILEALSCFDILGLRGGVVIAGGKLKAFAIGTPLTPDTAVIQIEIADSSVPGLAQWINREFVRREWSGFRFINREQDLGLPGLRRAKQSYHPHHLVKKVNVFGR